MPSTLLIRVHPSEWWSLVQGRVPRWHRLRRIDHRRFKATSSMEVLGDNDVAVVRYRSLIDIAVRGQPVGLLACWHLDCYRRAGEGDPWRVRWSQATEIRA